MNQKIIKLVRQALKESASVKVESVIASRIDDHGIVEIPNTFAEKFAEMIIADCLDICQECIDDGCVEAEEPMWMIKEHFGVEE
jgi:hypothetical protein